MVGLILGVCPRRLPPPTGNYTYDPLYRLTGAVSKGSALTYTFGYVYDAVGNRTVQTRTITSTAVSNYVYDNANRLTSINGQSNTWDNNGNLLNDGASLYAYDQANRLKTLTQTATVYSFGYNGVGDRLQQIIAGSLTTYTLDLNTGLTQVLADGDNRYVYGNSRVAQYAGASASYFLVDGLGSVRQLADNAGNVTLAERYEPFGALLSSTGSGTSEFGFAGEQTDATGLEYLRARYYAPGQGRLTTKDTWQGDYRLPATMVGWNYAGSNPVDYTDHSGFIKQSEGDAADKIVASLATYYHVYVEQDWGLHKYSGPTLKPGHIIFFYYCNTPWLDGDWTLQELQTFENSVHDLGTAMLGPGRFIANIGGVDISKGGWVDFYGAGGLTWPHRIEFASQPDSLTHWTAVHELGHAWDGNSGWRLSAELQTFTGGTTDDVSGGLFRIGLSRCTNERAPGCNGFGYFYGGTPAAGSDQNFNAREDFAESVAAYVDPDGAQSKVKQFLGGKYEQLLYYPDYKQTARWQYVNRKILGQP